ncbi:MAG: hypothetical protein JO069_05620 [Verrucomicrobia bacterium]|nr:hypothetical protein [Verrucomicrobiota bacterium]
MSFESDPPKSPALQDNVVSHTGADAATRILAQPAFKGEVEPGLRVVIVDDVVSFGATLANLRGWLERQGAVVVGATTLAATYGGTKLKLPEGMIEARPGAGALDGL